MAKKRSEDKKFSAKQSLSRFKDALRGAFKNPPKPKQKKPKG